VRFEILGPLRVRNDGTIVDIGGPRQQRVLACLLASYPDAISVDRLIDEVWGDEPPQTAMHVIRTYVSNLRKVMGDRIASDGTRYRFEPADDEIDAVEARAALDGARAGGSGRNPVAQEALYAAGQLWRGPGFGDLADDSPLLRSAAADLEELMLQIQEERIAASLAAGRHDAVISDAERLCRVHPYRERLHGHLMVALYRAGRQVEALRTYTALRSRLAEDLGIDPSPQLQDLEERILLQDGSLALEPPHVLPTPVSSFVGRGYEVAEVAKLVDTHRLVTLTGPGGVGKTRLANEASRTRLRTLAGGVWWIDLHTTDDAEDVLERIARVLTIAEQRGVALLDAIANFVAGRPTLFVLDNCERLLPEVGEIVNGLLERAADLQVLCTSRTALGVVGEVRWTVPPLSLPANDQPRGVSDAERLFAIRASELGAPVDLADPGVAGAVERLCRDLDGLPLAIELAAARTTVLSPRRIVEELEAHLGVLESTAPGLPDRHRTINATIDWSHRLLTRPQQTLFDRLGCFAATFDIDAATAVAGFEPLTQREVVPAFDALAAASMLHRVGNGWNGLRYRLLDTMRRYAQDRLDERAEAGVVAYRHARHHLELLERAGAARLTREFANWVEVIDASRDDLGVAVAWGLDNQPDLALRAAPGLWEYWFRRGDPAPAYDFGIRVLEAVPNPDPGLEAAARLCAGFGGIFAGDVERATSGIDRAIELVENGEDWRGLVWALSARGQNATMVGDLPTAAQMGARIVGIADRRNEALVRAYGVALLGEAEFFGDGDLGRARQYMEEAVAGFRELRDSASLNIFGLGITASIAALQKDYVAAEEFATEATALPGPGWSATAFIILGGWVLHPRGDLDRAERVLRRGIDLAQQMSMEPWVRNGLLFLSRVASTRGDWERAARLIGACHPQPPFGMHPRWWTHEPAVRTALGDKTYTRLVEQAKALPLDEIVDSLDQ
jgi:predicted ATPase/DNA-binding SARP family transcriptional activator